VKILRVGQKIKKWIYEKKLYGMGVGVETGIFCL
jgi:hypothetical protein